MGFHPVACFWAQQAAEKALKALLYGRGERQVLGHSAVELLAQIGPPLHDDEALLHAARPSPTPLD